MDLTPKYYDCRPLRNRPGPDTRFSRLNTPLFWKSLTTAGTVVALEYQRPFSHHHTLVDTSAALVRTESGAFLSHARIALRVFRTDAQSRNGNYSHTNHVETPGLSTPDDLHCRQRLSPLYYQE